MTGIDSSILNQEIDKFAKLASQWWDRKGPLQTLHDINLARLQFIETGMNLAGKTVLDVGCGGGILSEAMAKSGAVVTGIDAESAVIVTAENHADENSLSIQYHCTPIEDYESESYDAITCMELLEHVHQPRLVLEHCKRLLKPGGMLFLSTLNRTLKAYLTAIIGAEYVLGILPKQTHDYDKFIKPSELNGMARSVGFKRRELSGMYYNPFTQQASLSVDVQVNYLMSFSV